MEISLKLTQPSCLDKIIAAQSTGIVAAKKRMGRVRSFRLRRGTWINGYQVRERLGRGWEGEVYRVREEYSQGQRVLKLYDPAHYRSKLMHPYGAKLEHLSDVAGIVPFCHGGYWEERDSHYIVMRFVDGVSLERLVAKRAMPLFRALRIVRDLLNIVSDCHARDCRVGDIHADNIILTAGDRPFIIDLDLGTMLTRRTAVEDITAAAQLLYYLNWNKGPYSADLRQVLPKHADALKARYTKATDVLDSLAGLMGA